MNRYCAVARSVFAVMFIGGGVVHIVLGRVAPGSYAAFGETAVFPWPARLWESFVMPNIGWLTLVLAALEVVAGVGLAAGRRWVRIAVLGIWGFFGFLLLLGYGFPAAGPIEDVLKNRIGTVVLAALLIPVLAQHDPGSLAEAWPGVARKRWRDDQEAARRNELGCSGFGGAEHRAAQEPGGHEADGADAPCARSPGAVDI